MIRENATTDIGINLEVSAAVSTILNPFDPDWVFNLLSAVSQKRQIRKTNKKTVRKLG